MNANAKVGEVKLFDLENFPLPTDTPERPFHWLYQCIPTHDPPKSALWQESFCDQYPQCPSHVPARVVSCKG